MGNERDPYRELFERSADAILIIEGERFVDCNDAAVEMLRYSTKEEVLQTHPSELSPPSQPDGRTSFEKANEYLSVAFDRGSHRFEWEHVRADGESLHVEVLLTAIEEAGRRTLHVTWRDIAERKLLEEQLRQAQKMEAVGQLTGGIAHDFNNLLVVLMGHSELLVKAIEDRPEALDHVRGIQNAGERARELVRQLLAFGRKQQLLPTIIDLNELVVSTSALLERLIGEHVVLVTDTADRPIPVLADRTQLERVLLNLATNARDAMPDGGEIRLETSVCTVSERDAARVPSLRAGEYGRLLVADSGAGMDPEIARKAFEPFFTTKDAGRGSGLGLATVHGIVVQSGGDVSIASVPGRGTRIEVLLPLTADGPASSYRPDAEVPVGDPSRGSETVLVVEDEAAVSRLIRTALERCGYRVLSCGDGVEALSVFRDRHGEIDLVLTDVIMPRMGGVALATEIESLGHEPRVLFMSGYTDEGLSALHEARGDVDLLAKPFRVHELLRRVRDAVDRS